VVDMLDFREEAKWCLNLAEAETHPEMRTLASGLRRCQRAAAARISPGIAGAQG
jgi:hypothetical protein